METMRNLSKILGWKIELNISEEFSWVSML